MLIHYEQILNPFLLFGIASSSFYRAETGPGQSWRLREGNKRNPVLTWV